jgi:hypothetical protein
VVGGGLWYRFWRDDSPQVLKNKQIVAPSSEWSTILPGTWQMRWEYQSDHLGWLEVADVEYFADGTFKKHSTFTSFEWDHPDYANTSKLDIFIYGKKIYIKGGMISGKWKINLDKGNWEETITSFEVQGMVHPSWVVDKIPIGNYEDAVMKTHLEVFTQDSIKIIGKNYSDDAKISFFFKRPD